MAFLRAEYKVLAIFVVVVSILLALSGNTEGSSPMVAFSFIIGALCSALAGLIGMKAVSYTHLRAHETVLDLVCRLLLEKKQQITKKKKKREINIESNVT